MDKHHDWDKAYKKNRDNIFRKMFGMEKKSESQKQETKKEEQKIELPELELDEPEELELDNSDQFKMGGLFDASMLKEDDED